MGLIDTSELRTDVITAFGWHAKSIEWKRRDALELASVVWGARHILNLLNFMQNTWPKNPFLVNLSHIVEVDYEWFKTTFSPNSVNWEKRRLISELKDELFSLRNTPQFQRFFKNSRKIDKWFVIKH